MSLHDGHRKNSEASGVTTVPDMLLSIVLRHIPYWPAATKLSADTDLAASGLDSLAMVNLVIDLETTYGIAIPDELLDVELFRSPAALWSAISPLVDGQT